MAGWRVEVGWECDLKDEAALTVRLEAVLDQAASVTASTAPPANA